MSLDLRGLSNDEVGEKSPNTGDFIGVGDISEVIHEILDINADDIDEQILELISLIQTDTNNGFIRRDNGSIVKTFSGGKYIRLLEQDDSKIIIDMIQMPQEGIKAMLEIFSFSVDNGYKSLELKVQAQKNSSKRRTKILGDFYTNFGFSSNDGLYFHLDLSPKNKIVIRNKLLFYIRNGKWFK